MSVDIEEKSRPIASSQPAEAESSTANQARRFMYEFSAGFVGGAAARLVGHPVDTVKVLLQTHDMAHHNNNSLPSATSSSRVLPVPSTSSTVSSRLSSKSATTAARTPSSLTFIYNILRNNSGLGFFRGVSPPMLSDGVISAVLFGVYKYTQKALDPSMEDKSVMIMASMLAAVAAMVPSVPVEVVKVRLQMEAQRPHSHARTTVRQCIRNIFREHGLRGFYRGGLAQGLVDLPGTLVYFPIYDLSMSQLKRHDRLSPETRPLLSGALAGLVSTLVVTPTDVLKTRIQGNPNVTTLRAAVRQLRFLGGRGFFLGWHYSAAAFSLISATQFFVYENMIHRFGLQSVEDGSLF